MEQIEIAQYPFIEKQDDRENMVNSLVNEQRAMLGYQKIDEKLDRSSLDKFKKTAQQNSRLIKVSDNINKGGQEK